jgi:hypothetical protein
MQLWASCMCVLTMHLSTHYRAQGPAPSSSRQGLDAMFSALRGEELGRGAVASAGARPSDSVSDQQPHADKADVQARARAPHEVFGEQVYAAKLNMEFLKDSNWHMLYAFIQDDNDASTQELLSEMLLSAGPGVASAVRSKMLILDVKRLIKKHVQST